MFQQFNIHKLYQQKYLDSFNIEHSNTLQYYQSINQLSSTDSIFNVNTFTNQSQLLMRNPQVNDLSALQSQTHYNSKKNSFNCPTIPNLSYVRQNLKKPLLFPKSIVGKDKKTMKKQRQKQGDGKGLMNIKNNSLHTLSEKDKQLGNLKQILTRNRSELKNKQYQEQPKNQLWSQHETILFSKYKQKQTQNCIIRQNSAIKEKYHIITGIQRKREPRLLAKERMKSRDNNNNKVESRESIRKYSREAKKRVSRKGVGESEEQIEIKPWQYDIEQM